MFYQDECEIDLIYDIKPFIHIQKDPSFTVLIDGFPSVFLLRETNKAFCGFSDHAEKYLSGFLEVGILLGSIHVFIDRGHSCWLILLHQNVFSVMCA
jgi:hypothetical protein